MNWNTRYAAENCSCHGWPKLQCPNTTEADKHLIAEVGRSSDPKDSVGRAHSRSQEVHDFLFGE